MRSFGGRGAGRGDPPGAFESLARGAARSCGRPVRELIGGARGVPAPRSPYVTIGYLALALLLLLPVPSWAGRIGTTYLVPAYEACPRGQTTTTTLIPPPPCVPARRESSFTFDTATLKTSGIRYLAVGKPAFVFTVKGVRDASGNLVTTDPNDPADDFMVISAPGQVTLTFLNETFQPGVLAGPVVVRFDLKNGAGKATYKTPSSIPDGVVTETGSIIVLDNQGKRLAALGAQSPPATAPPAGPAGR